MGVLLLGPLVGEPSLSSIEFCQNIGCRLRLESFLLGPFVWELSLGSFRLETPAWDCSLHHFRWGFFGLELSRPTSACSFHLFLLLGNVRFGIVVGQFPLGNFPSGDVDLEPSVGNFRLGSWFGDS